MPVIRKSNMNDISVIAKLWKESFGDSDDYINLFVENRFSPDCCMLLEENGSVIGMAHLLPCTVNPGIKALYFYAVCIREDMRNKGYFRYFVTNLLKEAQKNGFISLCVPFPGLEKVYQKFGFRYPYTASEAVYDKTEIHDQLGTVNIENALPADFLHLFKENGGVNWNIQAVQYAFLENAFCNGKQLKALIGATYYPFFAINKGDHYLIDYHNLDPKLFETIKDKLFSYLTCKKIVFRYKGDQKIIGLSDSNLVDVNSKISMTLG